MTEILFYHLERRALEDVVEDYDVILDGTDNFPTRYLVNDACVLTGKPNAYGSIFRFEGQASVFAAKDGPCYRCLYPEPPPPGLVPSCAEGGVLGVLPGIIGTIQAAEAIKLILMTSPGERPMRPRFGCRIHDLVFTPTDPTTAGRMEFEVRSALQMWEPRIDVNEIDILFDTEDPALLYIDIRYSIKHTNDPRNLVFPFYMIPSEEEEPTPEELAAQVEMVSEE